MQAMGAVGARADYPLARHLAAVKLAEYMDGTTGIQNVVIARSLFRDRPGAEGKAAE
jgi:alkylation response protein AidB-like acyl-CoA dehydrogenase